MTDYLSMWKDLDMDLETHNLLCEALPQSFGDIYLSQKNRPENMAFYDFVVSEIHGVRPAELIELQKEGKKVYGTFCIFVPDEIIIAADGVPTGLCAGSQFWVPGGEKLLPKNTCSLIKASVGARIDKTCPFFRIADMYVGETTCDGKKKAYEILAEEVPMHVMDMPQMKRERDYEKWEHEIYDFKNIIEEFSGNTVSQEKLAEAISLVNKKRAALARVFEARKSDIIPISGKDALLMTQIAFYDDVSRCTEMANKLADELEQRIKDGVGVFPAGTKRIMITGTPMSIPNWKMHHIIETSGAAVVVEECCTGTRYFENLVREDATTIEEQIEALAERYMHNNCACFTPNEGRLDDICRLADEYHVDGVIDAHLMFCGLYDSESRKVSQALQEKGIPVLSLETDYTDNDAGQLRTRVGAFIEMLND